MRGVQEDVLLMALDEGFVPVVATVAADADGNFLNAARKGFWND